MSISRRRFVQGGTAALIYAASGCGLRGKMTARTSRNELYPDPLYTKPYVDVDEWRDAPVRHRYVHGGFTETELRFSMYFPPAQKYAGRFFHPVMNISGNEKGAFERLGGMDGRPPRLDDEGQLAEGAGYPRPLTRHQGPA